MITYKNNNKPRIYSPKKIALTYYYYLTTNEAYYSTIDDKMIINKEQIINLRP